VIPASPPRLPIRPVLHGGRGDRRWLAPPPPGPARSPFTGEDVVAQRDALVADVDAGPGDQLLALAFALPAERAPRGAIDELGGCRGWRSAGPHLPSSRSAASSAAAAAAEPVGPGEGAPVRCSFPQGPWRLAPRGGRTGQQRRAQLTPAVQRPRPSPTRGAGGRRPSAGPAACRPWWLPVGIGGRACRAGSRGPMHPATCPPIRAGRADATPDPARSRGPLRAHECSLGLRPPLDRSGPGAARRQRQPRVGPGPFG
jgi:hypothetical protein